MYMLRMRFWLSMFLTAATFLMTGASGNIVIAAELVMVDRAGCPWCAKWDRQVGLIYDKTDEARVAPLRRISLDDGQPKLNLKTPVRYTPTFLLVDGDVEIGRITGFMDDASFWGLLDHLLTRLEPASRAVAR
jgi:thioredoxin-related protein